MYPQVHEAKVVRKEGRKVETFGVFNEPVF
jgi:hypothetical protein